MSRQKATNESLTKLARAGGNKKALGEYDEKGSQDEAASERPANPLEVSVGHLLEANLITPVVLGRRFTLNPVVVFVSLIFWTWLWGMPGALLSVPILVSAKVICDRFPTLSSVSELLVR